MIVTMSSVRGAPGVSSWCLLLAAAWPTEAPVERVVVEADPGGGVFGARYGLGVDPGVARLVAAVRRHDRHGGFAVGEVARRVGEQVWVIPGPESAEAAAQEWGRSAGEVAAVAATDERVWLVDCGRLSPGSFPEAFVAESALSLVWCRPRVEELAAMPSRLARLHRLGAGQVGVVLVGKSDYGRRELVEFFGTGVMWQVRESGDVARLANAVSSQRRARRSWVWREAVQVANGVAQRVITAVGDAPAVAVESAGDA